ncbi:MAG: hypothetical protein BMS9Abin17_1267 [Acidimicrobiia bacterium]|nr:MAG: hypothetical protein BMS9Abin17_1267 [Acidimicrobiia bacterium]
MDNSGATFDATLNPVDDSVPMDRRGWREMTLETALLVPNLVKLVVRLLGDRRVPMRRKALLGVVLLYVISPIDLIPDFIVGFGRLDDIILLSLAIDRLMTGSDQSIVAEHWDGSVDALDLVRSVFRWGAEVVPGKK